MKLTSKQVRYLRGLAHALNPLVQLGKAGVGTSQVGEVRRSLADHELIKVRITADDRLEFRDAADRLAGETGAALVQTIGRIAVLYRPGDDPKIQLP